MKLSLGISPCPNDTFIFDALYHRIVSHPDIEFEFILEDVETLNTLAGEGQLDIVKLSYARFFQLTTPYILLRSGGAMGFGVGPLLVSNTAFPLNELEHKRIAIPGEHTTAHFLFRSEFPNANQKQFMLFSDVERALQQQEVDAAVLIHEGRFTYQEKGFYKLMDLGEAWEKRYHVPIPLGGIALKREHLPHYVLINQLIRESIQHAWTHYPQLSEFVTCHAQEMNEQVMRQHIELYVNAFSLDMGIQGEEAILYMKNLLAPQSEESLFLPHKDLS